MDPLSLLRDFNLKGRLNEVSSHGDRVNFGGQYVFPLSNFTAFKNAQNAFYSLDAVLNLLLNRHVPHSEYIKQAAGNKVGAIAFTDRKKLLDFLDGKLDLQLDAPEGLMPAIPAPPADQSDEPAAKRAKVQEVDSMFDLLAKQERQLRNRNSMLIAPNKEFTKVIEVATKALNAIKQQMIKQQQQQRHKAMQPHHDKHRHKEQGRPASASQHTIPIKPSGRLEREVLEDQAAAAGGIGMVSTLQMYGAYNTNTGGAANKQDQPPPPPPPPPPQGSGSGAAPKPPSSGPKPASKPAHGSSSRPSSSAKPSRPLPNPAADKPKVGGVPIIIVPSGLTAMLNMFNAKQFLESGRFQTSVDAQKAGVVKQPLLLVTRTAGKPAGSPGVPYHVIDKAPEKGSEDWKRVVAVIAQGAKWQFKDWPFKGAAEGELSEVFGRVCGFFIHYSDEKVPDTVTNWNVKRLGLHRENRHLDMTVVIDFFKHLDSFLMARKSTLAF